MSKTISTIDFSWWYSSSKIRYYATENTLLDKIIKHILRLKNVNLLSITRAELNLLDVYNIWQIIITNNIINKGAYRKSFQSIVKLSMFYFNRFEINRWLTETCLEGFLRI